MLRNRKKPINQHILSRKITVKKWETHFNELFKNSTPPEQQDALIHDSTEEEYNKNGESITKKRIQQTIGKLKNKKSPRTNIITSEMIKHGGDALVDELHRFFNKILTLQIFQEQWQERLPKTYQCISLLSPNQNLFTEIHAEEESITEIEEEQPDFRTNRYAVDVTFSSGKVN